MRDERIRPTQPYMVLDGENFMQEVYLKQGISHFFQCSIRGGTTVRIVPTGCIDITFLYSKSDGYMRAVAVGTFLQYTEKTETEDLEMFGVRLFPGFHPSFLKYSMVELVDRIRVLDSETFSGRMIRKMQETKSFYERVGVFLKEFTALEDEKEEPFGKRELLEVVKETIYRRNGLIEIASLEEITGYSTRYINRVFMAEMGFSPKVFCKILQFQHAVEFLNYGSLAWSYGKMDDNLPTKMADIATFLGYYDQPQFIRDFKKYAGITPKRYLDMVSDGKYRSRTNSSDFYNRFFS